MNIRHSAVTIATGLLVVGAFFLPGCGKDDHGHDHDKAPAKAASAAEATSNRIPVPASVRANLGITFAKVESRNIAATKRYPGRFEADADARREYRAPVAGIVEPLVKPYQRVAVGDPLLRISGRGWAQMQRDWLESRAPTTHSDDAVKAAVASRRALFTAQVAAAAGVAIDDPKLEALATAPALTIHARSAGVVEPQVATAGTAMEEGAALLAMLDPTRVRLRANIPQGDLGVVKESQPARIVPAVDGWKTALPARLALGLEADATLRTQDLLAWPTPKDGEAMPVWARPGVTALLEVQIAGGGKELAIPVTATIRDGLDTIIFRRDPAKPDEVMRLPADLGVSDGTWVELLSGVREGDEVVVDGIYQLKLSGAGKAELGGHFHSDGSFHAEPDEKDK